MSKTKGYDEFENYCTTAELFSHQELIDIKLNHLLSEESRFFEKEEKDVIRESVHNNPLLDALFNAQKLHFGVSHKTVYINSLASPELEESKSIATMIIESVDYFNKKWETLSSSQRQYLLFTTSSLIASAEENHEHCFENIIMEYYPDVEAGSMADGYRHHTQSLEVCFSSLRDKTRGSIALPIVIAHEYTHAIDDIYHRNRSSEKSLIALSQAPDKSSLKKLAENLALIADPQKTLSSAYLKDELAGEVTPENLKSWRTRITRQKNMGNTDYMIHQNASQEDCLQYGPMFAEFLAFHSERLFNALKRPPRRSIFAGNEEASRLMQEVTSEFYHFIYEHAPEDLQKAIMAVPGMSEVIRSGERGREPPLAAGASIQGVALTASPGAPMVAVAAPPTRPRPAEVGEEESLPPATADGSNTNITFMHAPSPHSPAALTREKRQQSTTLPRSDQGQSPEQDIQPAPKHRRTKTPRMSVTDNVNRVDNNHSRKIPHSPIVTNIRAALLADAAAHSDHRHLAGIGKRLLKQAFEPSK